MSLAPQRVGRQTEHHGSDPKPSHLAVIPGQKRPVKSSDSGARMKAGLHQDEQEPRQIVDLISQAIIVLNPDGKAVYANRVALDYTGLSLDEVRADNFRDRCFHPEDIQRLREPRKKALFGATPFENEQRVRRKDGRYRWFLIQYSPLLDENGEVVRWYATGTDIEYRKLTETLRFAEKSALEMIADGASLREVLDRLCNSIEVDVTPSVATIMLMDEDRKWLYHGGGERVSEDWISRVTPVPVAAKAGLCGTAAFLKQRVIVPDVLTDANWPEQCRDLAIRNGIRAAWSEPILTKDNDVLGTFALYSQEARVPTDEDLALIRGAGELH